ncbi:MAG: transposase [Candidatus Thermoplasmatota archaeon]|nr:transposase [Candidatus Thermoplasmatota archaeon]
MKLSKPLKRTLVELITCLLENNKAHLCKLGEELAINGPSKQACNQRIRRFLSNKRMKPEFFVRPLIYLMRPLLERLSEIVLSMDRTDWKKRGKWINILSVSVCYKGRALPLCWMVFGRRGNSALTHWKQVLTPVILGLQLMDWLSGKPLHVVADREFASPKLAEWLKETFDVGSTLRMKASMYLKDENKPEVKIASLIKKMKKGKRRVLRDQQITRDSSFKMNVLLTWDEKYDEPLVVATTSSKPWLSDKIYGFRFGIECMHKDYKSNAFDLEKTKVTDPKRIETMLIPIAFAYVLCMIEGERKEMAGEDISKPPKGKIRMVGLFLDGLRSISRHLRRANSKQFKRFIRQLLSSFLEAWKIKPSHILDT